MLAVDLTYSAYRRLPVMPSCETKSPRFSLGSPQYLSLCPRLTLLSNLYEGASYREVYEVPYSYCGRHYPEQQSLNASQSSNYVDRASRRRVLASCSLSSGYARVRAQCYVCFHSCWECWLWRGVGLAKSKDAERSRTFRDGHPSARLCIPVPRAIHSGFAETKTEGRWRWSTEQTADSLSFDLGLSSMTLPCQATVL